MHNKLDKLENTEVSEVPETRLEFVKRKLKEQKKTQTELAEALGMERQNLSRKLKISNDKEAFNVEELVKIAKFLDIPIMKALGKLSLLTDFNDEAFIYLHILGTATQGIWMQTLLESYNPCDYEVIPREGLSYPNLYGLRVGDEGMQNHYPADKTTLVCVPFDNVSRDRFHSGAHVIVARKNSLEQYEVTVKELKINDDGVFVTSDSANDNFLTYQISQDDGSDAYYGTQDLKIIGLVVHAVIEQPVPNSKNGKKGLPTL